jgi:hypothetical protein
MLTDMLENKAARPAKARSAGSAREDLVEAQARLTKLDADIQRVEGEVAAARGTGNDVQLRKLLAQRGSLWSQHASYSEDVVHAEAALKAAEGAEAEAVLEREIKALYAKYVEAAKHGDAALAGMAAVHGELLALNGEHQALSQRLAAHQRRFGSAPADFIATDAMRTEVGFVAVFERAVKVIARLKNHRAFLGDAKTEAEARRRWNTQEYRTRQAQLERMAARVHERSDANAGTVTERLASRARKLLGGPAA